MPKKLLQALEKMLQNGVIPDRSRLDINSTLGKTMVQVLTDSYTHTTEDDDGFLSKPTVNNLVFGYTNNGDVETPPVMVVREPITGHTSKTYAAASAAMANSVAALRSIFSIRRNSLKTTQHNLKTGFIDRRSLHKAPFDPHIFKMSSTKMAEGIDIALLIDESGSTSGSVSRTLREICVLFANALSGVPKVRLRVYGHSTSLSGREAMAMFEYYDSKNPKLRNLTRLGNTGSRGSNYDGFAIQWVADKFADSNYESKWLLVMSDGAPNGGHGYYDLSAIRHTSGSVQYVEKKGINVVGIGVAARVPLHKLYTHYIDYSDKLLDDVRKLIIKIIKDSESRLREL